MLAVLSRRFPSLAHGPAIRALFEQPPDRRTDCRRVRLSGRTVQPRVRASIRLGVAAEAGGGTGVARDARRDGRGRRHWNLWRGVFVARFLAFLPLATYPCGPASTAIRRSRCGWPADYPDEALRAALTEAARRWYSADVDCQAWEPGGDEFLSPALIEAECMRAVLPAAEFGAWFAAFLPRLGQALPASLFTAGYRQRPQRRKIAHLDGLNLSRAWWLAGAGRVHAGPGGGAAGGAGAPRCQPAACQRHVYG